MFDVARAFVLPPGIDSLAAVADAEGFHMVTRLATDHRRGENRFERPGEALWAAYRSGDLIGVCGLNRDPFADPNEHAGRVRRLYVHPDWRRRGAAGLLLDQIVAHARGQFSMLTAYTTNESAHDFYIMRGFTPVTGIERRSFVLTSL